MDVVVQSQRTESWCQYRADACEAERRIAEREGVLKEALPRGKNGCMDLPTDKRDKWRVSVQLHEVEVQQRINEGTQQTTETHCNYTGLMLTYYDQQSTRKYSMSNSHKVQTIYDWSQEVCRDPIRKQ